MTTKNAQSPELEIWRLAKNQHGVVGRAQLLQLGFTPAAIRHRVAGKRLHLVMRGVYAIGRPELGQLGSWMAAVLASGSRAALSHQSAAAAWRIRRQTDWATIEVSVDATASARTPGVWVHRRTDSLLSRVASVQGVPVTDPVLTLVDLAPRLRTRALEAAISEADKLDLVNPEALRCGIDELFRIPGATRLRRCLDRSTFALTDSELERRFLSIVRTADLTTPLTGQRVNGFKTDFYWPSLGLIVETDGLRYHRTAAQQAKDRKRDQAHTRVGLTTLRFTHAQVRYEPAAVKMTLAAVGARLRD